MATHDLFRSVKETIVDVLDLDDDGGITETTTADDVEGWDSLQHVRILTTIEKKFRFRFTDAEIGEPRNVGDLVRTIATRASVS